VRSTSFYDDEGRFAGYVGTCSDITDRKRQEQIKDDFLALASHELKTPLASLIGYIHLLERWSAQDGFGERIKQALAAMLSEGVRLNRLINDLLDVSRIQTSKLQMFMQPINLTGLLQDCLAKLQVMLPDYRWLAQIAPEPLLINADAQRIEQALTNLCTNAAKYSAEHAPIMVGLRRAERGVQITVQDHGLGIPAADLPYIFDRFYQVQRPPRESRPGLGLGLFITREIIRQHGGVITVESVEHGGSIFTILLPLEQAPSKRD
jgi:signal transduction histidine kinase